VTALAVGAVALFLLATPLGQRILDMAMGLFFTTLFVIGGIFIIQIIGYIILYALTGRI
jgi:hypothetical protein